MSDPIIIAAPGGFGPCFPIEAVAAGFDLAAPPWTMQAYALVLPAGTVDAMRSRVVALVAAHDPTKPVPSPAAVTIVLRSDLFRRCTDDEADKIDAALFQTSTRMRNLFASVQTFRSDAPEWQQLHDTAVTLFGEARAAQLLAPST